MSDRIIHKRMRVGAIILVTWGLVAALWADETPSVVNGPVAVPSRVLYFPQDKSVGVVYLQDEDIVIPETVKGFHSGHTYAEIENFSCARDEVRIPEGKRVILCIRGVGVTPERYSTALKSLKPDDLYGLLFFSLNPVYFSDDLIEPITRLTGLRKLDLSSIGVSQRGLALLSQLPHVEELTTPKGLSDAGMAEIAKMQSLKRLHVALDQLTDMGLRSLGKLANLEELNLYGNPRMTNNGLKALTNLRLLRYLRLGKQCPFTNRGIAHLSSLPSLRVLWLDTHNITDEALRGLARSRSLERLNMFWLDKITDRGIIYLKDMPRLRKLDVGHARLSDAGLAHFAAYGNLDYLRLPVGFTDVGIKNLADAKHLKYLWVNCSSGSRLTDKTLVIVSNLRELEELYISGTGFTDKGLELLAKLDNLRVLNLIGFGRDGLDNENLKQLVKLSKLRELFLGSAGNITMSGLNTLSTLSDLENLSVDDVHRDDGGLDISGLKNLKSLKIGMWSKTTKIGSEFVTNYESFRDSDLKCMSGLTEIENLSLTGPGIGDDGFKNLTSFTKLKHFQITGSTNLTDEGLKHLANMRRLDSLTIHNSRITQRGLVHLYPLKTLHIIRIKSKVPISGSAITRLRIELPNLQIINISRPEPATGRSRSSGLTVPHESLYGRKIASDEQDAKKFRFSHTDFIREGIYTCKTRNQ